MYRSGRIVKGCFVDEKGARKSGGAACLLHRASPHPCFSLRTPLVLPVSPSPDRAWGAFRPSHVQAHKRDGGSDWPARGLCDTVIQHHITHTSRATAS
jgi:hypothetical protein